jgi:hypothetical protein
MCSRTSSRLANRKQSCTSANHLRSPIVIAATAIAAAAILSIGIAASRGVAAGPEAAPSPQANGYLPSISDLMIATIQPRHERLWRAGQDGNWEFAAYELGNLHGAFGRIGQAHPITQNISFPEMIASVTEQPFKGAQQRGPVQRRHSIWQGLCRPDRRVQFLPPGAQPRRG